VLLLPDVSFGIPNANVLLKARLATQYSLSFFASGIKGLAFLFMTG